MPVIKLIVIGCSAGKIQQLKYIFSEIKYSDPLTFIIVQHLSKTQAISNLSNIFQNSVGLKVEIPFDKKPIREKKFTLPLLIIILW